ncbi:hypothetical protein FE257_007631 [Aspergillus nanangensis]|uniref:Acetyl-CoA synthetase-like protein n=1 Tax=Aspergillus nanangensis TaxID=2582783 RepID=A0AAD4CP55_ASPNN|nr:hypothetical protein FE257_007631 [Aspergillus nanangensis]
MTQPITYTAPHQIPIPTTDIASFIFSGDNASKQSPQYFDADAPSRNYSLAQAELYVKQVAHGLQTKLGLQPDDKVLLFSGNNLYVPVLLWGVTAAGGVFTAANPAASESELEYQLKDSTATVLLTHPAGAAIAARVAERCGLPANRVYLFIDPRDKENYVSSPVWTDFWSRPEEVQSWTWRRITTADEAQAKTAILNYSSGTTGAPKGVEISHYNAIANCEQLVHKRGLVAATAAGEARKARLDASGERWLCALPMYHAYGQTYFCLNAARLNAKVYIMAKYDLNRFLLYIDTYRITFLSAVPVILNMIAKHPRPTDYNLQSIESVTTGSAPLNPETGRAVAKLFLRPGVSVKQGLGMTECTCSLSGFAPDDEDDGRSVGWLNANCKVRVVPVDGEDFSASLPAGVTGGELWIAGPNVMKGYFDKPEKTAETIVEEVKDGEVVMRWLRTGDIGYVDAEGRIYVVDRLKELIKVKGLQVSPAELELTLLEHSGVADAAVVGAKIDENEYPRAFVVRKSEAVTAKELQDLIASRFARHKWLTGGVVFIDAIPRTGSGKIIRRALHQMRVPPVTKL